ncbi:MAG: hypothetical protein IBX68_06115 [Dehalococcoidia bacterium]|nr:hypothetical protein [Dehalococcoidia bacterium]
MRLLLTGLERSLIRQSNPDLAGGALVASGITSALRLDQYLMKIGGFGRRLGEACPSGDQEAVGRYLFEALWLSKPQRYEVGGKFRLNECLEAQLDPSAERVGNCLGLTILYNVFAGELGLTVKAAHVEEAFGLGPHVFSLLYSGKKVLDIENIFPGGFDYKEHSTRGRMNWDNRSLIADIYCSAGNEAFENGDLKKALGNYRRALLMNPAFQRANLNRGITLALLGHEEEAAEIFDATAKESGFQD